ncbi:MAG: NERD domain-containing protein [Planctomycetes bacterium]|nr:NERD domain-containing protein [Planctomycetota bacterium]
MAAQRLTDRLATSGFVIGNYLLPGKYSGGEIDLVAVLPSGIVAIEVKHWYGRIMRVGGTVEFDNGYSVPNPFPGLLYKAKFLRSHLVERDLIGAHVSVGSCLVHGPGRLAWPDDVLRNQYVYDLDTAPVRIGAGAMLPREGRRTELGRSELVAIADALADPTSGAEAWRIGHFVVDEELAATPFARQFVGRCSHVRERDVLLRCWEIDPLADEDVQARTLRRLESEAAALARLESQRCPAIPIVYDAFPDPANFHVFWTALEYGGPATLARERRRFLTDQSFRDGVLAQIGEALAAFREAGIVHRNLGAEVITLCDDGRILVGGLEYSAAEDGSTRRRTIAHPSRVPPEVVAGAGCSSAGDMFAVGLMVLDLLMPGDDPPDRRLARLRDRPLRSALGALLERAPEARVVDLNALRAALRNWTA